MIWCGKKNQKFQIMPPYILTALHLMNKAHNQKQNKDDKNTTRCQLSLMLSVHCLSHLIKPQNTNPFHRISLQDFLCTGIFGSSSLALQTTIHFKEIISETQLHKRYVNT